MYIFKGWCDMTNDPNAAEICDTRSCNLPDCFCSKDGTEIPRRLNRTAIPQMIIITFGKP